MNVSCNVFDIACNHDNNVLLQCNKLFKNKIFTLPFTESDVLYLQDMFISPGIHEIRTTTIKQGRCIMQTILDSLKYFHAIGCITNESGLSDFVCDIQRHIALDSSYNHDAIANLEYFLTIHPCFDFIWIELTDKIAHMYTIDHIKNIFNMYQANERMSVIIVQYYEK